MKSRIKCEAVFDSPMFRSKRLVTIIPMLESEAYKKGYAREDGQRDGYMINYNNGESSWHPIDLFNKYYRQNGNLSFRVALGFWELGHKVTRKAWGDEDKGMHKDWTPSKEDMLAQDWKIIKE